MSTYTKDTFEMFWKCPACDRTQNFGVSHAFCPGCGHKQTPETRYFPSPEQRRSITPPSSGRQVTCSYCEVSNDPSHAFCQACGATLAGAKPVPLRPSIPEYAGGSLPPPPERPRVETPRPTPPTRRYAGPVELDDNPVNLSDYGIRRGPNWSAKHWAIAAACSLVALFVLLLVFWKKDISIEVQGHTWKRSIAIERFQPVHDSAWCTSKPGDAYNVSHRRELHHVNHVPNGQTCRTVAGAESCRTVDNGNGTGSTVCTKGPDRNVCETKYRDEPVYADKCYYDVDRWRHQRDALANGSRLEPEPEWPEPKFESCSTTRIGCERIGPRTQRYTVHFVSAEDDRAAFECDYPQAKWAGYKPGSTWAARVGVLWQRLDCDSLQRE